MCAFDLFKDFGLKAIDDDGFLNLAGLVVGYTTQLSNLKWNTDNEYQYSRYSTVLYDLIKRMTFAGMLIL